MFVEAGMTPLQALQTATLQAAKYLGMLDTIGSVEAGKIADLVLLDGNPLDDIGNTRTIAAVVVNGRLFTKSQLQQMLADAERAASRGARSAPPGSAKSQAGTCCARLIPCQSGLKIMCTAEFLDEKRSWAPSPNPRQGRRLTRTVHVVCSCCFSLSAPSTVFLMTDFDELYRCYVDAVFRFALQQVRRRDIAEEITSDTFVALYERLTEIDTAQLPNWLFTVARNRATDYWRRQVLENRFLAGYKPVDTVDPATEPEFERWLEQNPQLKPIHRVCLMLRYGYGMDRSEIAAGTGLTETQVKGLLQYARQILRRQFESAGRGRRNDASARSGR